VSGNLEGANDPIESRKKPIILKMVEQTKLVPGLDGNTS